MAQDWDIRPRAESCQECQTPFQDRQVYVSALAFTEDGYTRQDCCEPCWTAKKGAGARHSSWKGVFRVPPPPAEEALKRETAESLLRRLMEEGDRKNVNVVYILAVMLERKKILVERDVQINDDGAMIRVYEHRKTGETFLIPDPRLLLDQLEHVQQEVVAMLGGASGAPAASAQEGANPPADAASAASAAPAGGPSA